MFVCVPCAVAHRELQASDAGEQLDEVTACRKAQDASDVWSAEQLSVIASRGNARGAALWEAALVQLADKGDAVRPRGATATKAERMAFIHAKYVEKRYYNAAQLTEDDLAAKSAAGDGDATAAAGGDASAEEEVMKRRRLARLSMRAAAQGKGASRACSVLPTARCSPRHRFAQL